MKDAMLSNSSAIQAGIKSAGKDLERSNYTGSQKKILGGYYIFFSFDLVNSTEYKSKNQKSWPQLFSNFYELTRESIKVKFEHIQLWKYVGDEILFFLKINDKKDFYELCQKTLEVQREVLKSINNNFADAKGILYIKSTLWSANATLVESGSKKDQASQEERNLIFLHSNSSGISCDFLGPDIDTGFRISKFSEKNKLVVCAELAYILYKFRGQYEDLNNNRIEERLKIIGFEDLKGIWNGRKYPIIWYHDEWNKKDQMYEYDERFTSNIVANIFQSKFKLEDISFLKKVFEDIDLKQHIDTIVTKIEEGDYSEPFDFQVVAKNRAEVHCVGICINESQEILIAQRKEKEVLDGKWEFGCGQISIDSDFEAFLKETYKKDFNIEIEIIKEAEEALPVATYTLSKKDISIPGIIFVARVKSDSLPISYNQHKYSKAEFITLEELLKKEEHLLVPLMRENAKKAIDIYEQNFALT